jgi:hypothetical protein
MGVSLEDINKFPFSILRTAPFIEKLEIHVSSLLDSYLPIDILIFGYHVLFACSSSTLFPLVVGYVTLLIPGMNTEFLCHRQLSH